PDATEPLEALGVMGSHPVWFLEELSERIGLEETRSFVDANNQSPPLMLRVNRTRTDRDSLAKTLSENGLEVDVPTFVPEGLEVRDAGLITEVEEFQLGHCSVQDFAAQLVGALAAPEPGMAVLDACAAPGGKTCHVAELMGDDGRVIALDIHPGRTRLITENATRLGLSSITTMALDASDGELLGKELAALDAPQVDVALLDAPCSGLGTLRRHPELRLRKESELPGLVRLQTQLLDAISGCVKPGGHLVYSVCTVTRAEGIEQVKEFLARHSEFEPVWPELAALEPVKAQVDGIPVLETWPHRHGTDGFFAVRLARSSNPR
ncbi:MAG: SAM-dependent methyltransferase, partial [Myxococcota bacterium]